MKTLLADMEVLKNVRTVKPNHYYLTFLSKRDELFRALDLKARIYRDVEGHFIAVWKVGKHGFTEEEDKRAYHITKYFYQYDCTDYIPREWVRLNQEDLINKLCDLMFYKFGRAPINWKKKYGLSDE